MTFKYFFLTTTTYTYSEKAFPVWYFVGFFFLVLIIRYISKHNPYENASRLKTKLFKPKPLIGADEMLNKYFPYYKALDSSFKKKFIRRLEIFMDLKEIVTRQAKENATVNLLIGATAVQLTFGLKDFRLYSFTRILVYPEAYYNKIRKTYHKGEINVKQRLIVLSASHFLEGIKIVDDGLNLGLHEMAHALNVEAFEAQHDEFKYFFKEWEALARPEMQIIKNNNTHFLRKYASTNLQEMFAVCTEYFFEKADEFSKKMPKLYKALCNVYKQDPRSASRPIKK